MLKFSIESVKKKSGDIIMRSKCKNLVLAGSLIKAKDLSWRVSLTKHISTDNKISIAVADRV